MTTLSQSPAIPVTRRARTESARRIAAALIRIPSRFGAWVRDIADAGQLGPDPETEIGRWTGARV